MKKHIVCFGDSNTHGYCADPSDCMDGGDRFNEQERWTCLLQEKLGQEYLVLEEGLNGRTTAFPDPNVDGLSGLDTISTVLRTHASVDLLIIMLGTNDLKAKFSLDCAGATQGLKWLLTQARATDCWAGGKPNILVVAPPWLREAIRSHTMYEYMVPNCIELSADMAKSYALASLSLGCQFLDAQGIGEFNDVDGMHLTKRGHARLAEALAGLVPELI